jgi:SAM-dependent methyltransferase
MIDLLYRLLVFPLRWLNVAVRALSASTHRVQYHAEGLLRSSAEWFDHQLDAQWQWPRLGKVGFLERGVLTALAIPPGGSVLDLCCGDGFYARHFYASRASRIVAVDGNREALHHARRFNNAPNISYQYCDITAGIPPGPFDAVAWNAAIHHFSRDDSQAILRRVSAALAPEGVLCGETMADPNTTYEYARQTFAGAEELAELLASVFAHVLVKTTYTSDRVNLYFFAGQTATSLPCDPGRDDLVIVSSAG